MFHSFFFFFYINSSRRLAEERNKFRWKHSESVLTQRISVRQMSNGHVEMRGR